MTYADNRRIIDIDSHLFELDDFLHSVAAPDEVSFLRSMTEQTELPVSLEAIEKGREQLDRRNADPAVMAKFDHVVESSKVGVRKPELRFYEIACELAGVEPNECIFLDDLGINLKPARAMGMQTIKVGKPGPAIAELSALLDLPLG